MPVESGIVPAAGIRPVGGTLSPFPYADPVQPEGMGWGSQREPSMVSLAHRVTPARLAPSDRRCSAVPCLQSYTAAHQAAGFYPISC